MATSTKPAAPRATGARPPPPTPRRGPGPDRQLAFDSQRRPFRDLSVDQIASAAGLSRSAFYTHFRDKSDLLLAAVEEVAEELSPDGRSLVARGGAAGPAGAGGHPRASSPSTRNMRGCCGW